MSSLSHPVRRLLSEPAVPTDPIASRSERSFADDVRDVAVAYLAGLVAFGVMLF